MHVSLSDDAILLTPARRVLTVRFGMIASLSGTEGLILR